MKTSIESSPLSPQSSSALIAFTQSVPTTRSTPFNILYYYDLRPSSKGAHRQVCSGTLDDILVVPYSAEEHEKHLRMFMGISPGSSSVSASK